MNPTGDRSELSRSALSPVLLALCSTPRFRKFALQMSFRLERGGCFSMTAREIMRRHFGVTIGAYSYGGCFIPGAFAPPVSVGRYVSVARNVTILRRDHPTDRLSTHPFFFNSQLGYVTEDCVPTKPLEICHDAWIGTEVLVTAGCSRIGLGSIVGGGAVVTRDVPDFAIVGGVPARVIRLRFSEKARARIQESQWWSLPIDKCLPFLREMMIPLDIERLNHPLLRAKTPSENERYS
jgi:virginiamycin A acetyltransferase